MVFNPPAHELLRPGGGKKAPEEERDHSIVFENWHYVDFLTMTSGGYGFI